MESLTACRRIHIRPIVLCVLAVCLASCGESPEPGLSRLVVFVHDFPDHGIAGKRIEVMPTDQAAVTDAGGLAEFVVPPGHYVVRAYGINTPGPPPPFVEKSVDVGTGETIRVEIFNCTLCMGSGS